MKRRHFSGCRLGSREVSGADGLEGDLGQTRHITRKGGQDEKYRVGSSAKTREKKAK